MKNLMQAYNLVKKYGHVIGMVVELLVIVEESGKDKKLTKEERSKIMKILNKNILNFVTAFNTEIKILCIDIYSYCFSA